MVSVDVQQSLLRRCALLYEDLLTEAHLDGTLDQDTSSGFAVTLPSETGQIADLQQIHLLWINACKGLRDRNSEDLFLSSTARMKDLAEQLASGMANLPRIEASMKVEAAATGFALVCEIRAP